MNRQWKDAGPADAIAARTSAAEETEASGLGNHGAIEVLIDGQVIAIFRTEDGLFAVDGMCAHQGGPIAEGVVQDGCVTCPWHGWQYELATGIQTINRQPLQQTYPVRQRHGRLEIAMVVDHPGRDDSGRDDSGREESGREDA
tara:strand:+ start:155625 stop:156053 length:429 start_codon:yes stop_codon:yes gene_type:complete